MYNLRLRENSYSIPKFCQRFGMPMGDTDKLCVPNIWLLYMVTAKPALKDEEAGKIMIEWFPTLKR